MARRPAGAGGEHATDRRLVRSIDGEELAVLREERSQAAQRHPRLDGQRQVRRLVGEHAVEPRGAQRDVVSTRHVAQRHLPSRTPGDDRGAARVRRRQHRRQLLDRGWRGDEAGREAIDGVGGGAGGEGVAQDLAQGGLEVRDGAGWGISRHNYI